MEKLVYLLECSDSVSIEAFRSSLLSETVTELRDNGASQITINVADLNERLQSEAPGRLMGPWQDVSASVALWHDCIDRRAPIEACLGELAHSITGYLVTESVPQAFEPTWEGGERRPGVTQFGANGKPPQVSEEDFYHTWQVLHSTSSFDLHPLRWSYVRHAVARPLTTNAPAYRAIVSEHFREFADFADDKRYFGSQQAIDTMMEEVPGFCDFENMFSLAMSEYYFK